MLFMALAFGSFELNTHYSFLLNSYMAELEFKDLCGHSMSQKQVCELLVMDCLDSWVVGSSVEVLFK